MVLTAAFSRGIGLGIFAACLLVSAVYAEVPRKSDLPETAGATDLLAQIVYELDTVTVTANRRPQSDLTTPQALTVIPREEIDRRRARATTLADLLNTVPNFSQSFSGGRFIAQPRLRGGLGGQGSQSGLLILVDGIRRNNTNGTEDYLLDFPVDQIERIEVLRGPASVLYGTEAVDGVINLITRSNTEKTPFKVRTSLDIGSAQTVRTGFEILGKNEALRYQVRVSTQKVGDYSDANGSEQVRNRFSSTSYLGRFQYEIDAKSNLELEYTAARTQDLFLPIVRSGSPGRQTIFDFSFPYRNRDQVALTYRNRDFLGDFQSRIYYTRTERNFRNNIFAEGFGPTAIPTSIQDQQPILTSLGGITQFVTKIGDAKLTWGLDLYQENYVNRDIDLTSGVPNTSPERPNGTQKNLALFAQGAIPLAKDLTLTAGLRWDNYRQEAEAAVLSVGCPLPFLPFCPIPGYPTTNNFVGNVRSTSEIIPTVGLTWEFTQGATLRASYSRAIRNPNFFELYGGPQSVGITQGNPNLDTERSETWDGGIRVRAERFSFDFGYFLSNFTNKIVSTAIPGSSGLVLLPNNVRRVQGYGFELEANWRFLERFTLFGSFGSTTAYDLARGTRLPNVLPSASAIGLRYQDSGGLSGQLILRTVADYFAATTASGQGQGFTLLDLDFTLPLGGATRLGIGITNLTNAPYREAFTSFNAPGTQIFSSLVTEF
jgi:outer membrane receptor protein involved in Fe transport